MKEKKIHLRVITPEAIKVDEKVDMVIMRCNTGYMGILPGHEPRSAVLDYGVMKILGGAQETRWLAVMSGLAEIKNNVLTVLTGEAEWPQDIDIAHENTQRQRLNQRLQEHQNDIEFQRTQVMLQRSIVRIKLSSYNPVGESEWEE